MKDQEPQFGHAVFEILLDNQEEWEVEHGSGESGFGGVPVFRLLIAMRLTGIDMSLKS